MSISERKVSIKNTARAGIAALALVGGALTADGTRRAVITHEPIGRIELGAGAALDTVFFLAGRKLEKRELLALIKERQKEISSNPSAFPLHLIDTLLGEEEKRRMEDEEFARVYTSHNTDRRSPDQIAKSRKTLRKFQAGLRKGFKIDEPSQIPNRTMRSAKPVEIGGRNETLIVLAKSDLSDELKGVATKMLGNPDSLSVTEYDEGHINNQPSRWNGVNISFFKSFVDNRWHLVLKFDRTMLPRLLQEKDLLPPLPINK